MTWFNKEFNKYVVEGTAFELGGVQYPAVWLNQATVEQKAAIGLQEVVATNSPADDRFYWVSQTLDGDELTYTNTPKDLEPLKIQMAEQTNQTAYSLLFPSDWMVVKATETQTPIDPAWNEYRANVRATANQTRDAIAATTTVEDLEAVMDNVVWPHDPNWIEPVVEEPVVDVMAQEQADAFIATLP